MMHSYIAIEVKKCCHSAILGWKKRREKWRSGQKPCGFAAPRVKSEENKKRIRGEARERGKKGILNGGKKKEETG